MTLLWQSLPCRTILPYLSQYTILYRTELNRTSAWRLWTSLYDDIVLNGNAVTGLVCSTECQYSVRTSYTALFRIKPNWTAMAVWWWYKSALRLLSCKWLAHSVSHWLKKWRQCEGVQFMQTFRIRIRWRYFDIHCRWSDCNGLLSSCSLPFLRAQRFATRFYNY